VISKSFLKSSILYTIGGAMPMVSGILLLPFYANFFTGDQYVSLSFYISISLLLQIFFSYSIDSYFGVKYTQLTDEPGLQKQFVGTISSLLLIIGAGLILVSFLAGPFIFPLIFKASEGVSFWPFGIASIITGFLNSYFKTGTNALIYFKKPLQFLIFNLINFVATIGISLAGLFMFPDSLAGPIYGRLLSGVIIFFLGYSIFRSQSPFIFETKFLKELSKFCTPYLFFALSFWVLGNIDRYFLKSLISGNDLASYDLLLKCFLGIEFIQNALSAVVFPKVFAIWTKNNKNETTPESNRYFNVFTAVNVLSLIAFCILIPILLKLFISKSDYFQSFAFIGLIAAGYALRGVLNYYFTTILYSKKTTLLLKVFGTSAIIQIIFTYFLSKYFGLTGAICAGVITKIAQVFFSYYFTRPIFIYHLNYLKLYGIPLLFIFLNILCFILFSGYTISIYIAQLVFFTLLFYLVFKNEIKTVFKQFFG
jgi:O-antigen/teichoic acid export membrane protein